jgi:hypothetical protein
MLGANGRDEIRQIVIELTGSGTESSVMNPLAKTLRAEGVTVYAPEARLNGLSDWKPASISTWSRRHFCPRADSEHGRSRLE